MQYPFLKKLFPGRLMSKNIREEIAAIPAEMLAKTMEKEKKRAQKAISARGGHLRDIIFKNWCKQIYLEQIKWLRLPTTKFLFFSLIFEKKHGSVEYVSPILDSKSLEQSKLFRFHQFFTSAQVQLFSLKLWFQDFLLNERLISDNQYYIIFVGVSEFALYLYTFMLYFKTLNFVNAPLILNMPYLRKYLHFEENYFLWDNFEKPVFCP